MFSFQVAGPQAHWPGTKPALTGSIKVALGLEGQALEKGGPQAGAD